jgi:hypothetical protein
MWDQTIHEITRNGIRNEYFSSCLFRVNSWIVLFSSLKEIANSKAALAAGY